MRQHMLCVWRVPCNFGPVIINFKTENVNKYNLFKSFCPFIWSHNSVVFQPTVRVLLKPSRT